MLNKNKIIIFLILISCFSVFNLNSPWPALCAVPNNNNHNWIWHVLVIPPDDGWNTEQGKSIQAALKWEEDEIADSGTGVAGHDLKFIYLDDFAPRDESTIISTVNNANAQREAGALNSERFIRMLDAVPFGTDDKIIAVMSFAGTEVNRILLSRLGGNINIPVFLAGGEEVLIERNGRPVFNVFALDLFRDYRTQAFASYAAKNLKKDARIAVVASRFTENQEREAKMCYRFLAMNNFMPMPFWLDVSTRDAFNMVAQEIESSADGTMIIFLGAMGSREMWRNFMRVRTSWKLWNCSQPENLYLSYRYMTFADQNIFLAEHGGFNALRRTLWSARAVRVSDNVAAGRVHALVEWLKRGIATLSRPQPLDHVNIDRRQLLYVLARVQGIPFGNQTLDINPAINRPRSRKIFIADVRDRSYGLVDIVDVQGMRYEEF